MRATYSTVIVRLADPRVLAPVVLVVTTIGLWLDSLASLPVQMLLSAVPWALLIAACLPCSPEERARVAIVVVVATAGEILGSIVWGLYIYRLDNLPLFVPAGHGLVYLAGWRISQLPILVRHRRRLIAAVLAGVSAWGIVGLTGVLGRHDVAGAVGCLTVVAFLVLNRNAAVCAGVFLVVAYLEIYGTWVGTWTWQPYVPGLRFGPGIGLGNPPSGAASGYVVFDMCAVALAPWVVRRFARSSGSAQLDPSAPLAHEGVADRSSV
jgi:hypothetical protein